jgi:NAD(P)-dependent dehydrogenase (short-subunit alcohol dehydrogenase family)
MAARRILLTGIGGSIGTGALHALRASGDEVIGLAHLPGEDASIVADFTDYDALVKAVKSVAAPLDGVVLAHGILEPGPIENVPPDRWCRMMDVNINSLYAIIHTALPSLRDGASIVVVSSTAAFDHSPVGGPHYTASKWAVNGMVRHLAFDFGARRIRINAICPGLVEGPMGHALLTPEQYASALPEIPLGRAAAPSEIADLVMFLLGPASSYMTGALIPISGGYR